MKDLQLYYFVIQSVLLIAISTIGVEETNVRKDGPEIVEGFYLSLSLRSVSARRFDMNPDV